MGRRRPRCRTPTIRRDSVYVDGRASSSARPKTEDAHGEHWPMPTVVELLERRWEAQAEEREAAPRWETHVYDGERISLVFTTPTGGLVLRQTVAKVVKQAAKSAGILVDIATHVGRRRVVTLLYVEADEALEDIAHFVGHASQGEHDRRPREAARAASSNGGGAGGSSARRRGSESLSRRREQPREERRRTGRPEPGRLWTVSPGQSI